MRCGTGIRADFWPVGTRAERGWDHPGSSDSRAERGWAKKYEVLADRAPLYPIVRVTVSRAPASLWRSRNDFQDHTRSISKVIRSRRSRKGLWPSRRTWLPGARAVVGP